MSSHKMSKEEALAIGEEAYVFGYPLALMDVTRSVMTSTPHAAERKAPINQFAHLGGFPDPAMTDVVSPNADTLYSIAWLDLISEPLILSVPAMVDRYYLMEMLDAWTNVFASPGTRTTGSGKRDFAIVGPGWKGKLPDGFERLDSPTNMVWIIGRTQTNGKDDYAAVHSIQKQYALTPLSAWGKRYQASNDVAMETGVDLKTPPVDQVAQMDTVAFFSRINALMKRQPPSSADAPAMQRFETIGIGPGLPFDLHRHNRAVAEGLEQCVSSAQAKMAAAVQKHIGTSINGWDVVTNLGRYGTDYMFRALIALVGLGANLPDDAIYPLARTDANGEQLTGAKQYRVEFPKGQLPPVGAFWSITMYNSRQFFVKNPLNRYAIGDRDKLKFNADGSLTLYIQHQSPGAEKESNWLPSPKDAFNLVMRLYRPRSEILNGTWKMPPINRESAQSGMEAA